MIKVDYFGKIVEARETENPITGRLAYDLFDSKGNYLLTEWPRWVDEHRVNEEA